jgi:hypothetical protein
MGADTGASRPRRDRDHGRDPGRDHDRDHDRDRRRGRFGRIQWNNIRFLSLGSSYRFSRLSCEIDYLFET